MSRFTVKRSLKQLYIEKRAVQYMLDSKKIEIIVKGYERTVREVADMKSEQAFLEEILRDIENAEQKIGREVSEL